ncbi:MAG: ATP-binding protein [Nitrospinales bacterium]
MSLTGDDNQRSNSGLIAACIALAAGIFVLDLTIPLGVAAGVPYMAVVLVAMLLPGRKYLFAAAIAGTALTILGYFFSPPGGELWKVLFNRFLALLVIWVTAVFCLSHKRAEEKIEAAARFPSENPNPVLRCARTGKLLYANSVSEPLLREWGCEVGQMGPPFFREWIEAALDSRSTKTVEVEVAERIFLFDLTPIPEAGYVNFYGRDITDRKQLEKLREALLSYLGRANRELKDFAHVVSHDLKEPLRGISSLAHWIAEDYADVLDKAGQSQLNLLQENARRMHRLIEGILAYSRVGQEEPVPVRLDSGKIVKAVVDSLPKSDTIQINIENKLPEVVYHQTHLEQIFQNLIGNAIKHFGKPSGEIAVFCRENDGFWEFCVRDDGVGIDECHFERVFKIFETLDRKNYVESTGIGLALVRKIAEMHGGKAWVESAVGQGCSFFFTVPKVREEDLESPER